MRSAVPAETQHSISRAARTARSGSSPRATGAPNTASSSSPAKRDTNPPRSSTIRPMSRRHPSIRVRTSSGSIRSERPVNPHTSAKTTVAHRRSSAGSVGGGAVAGGTIDRLAPQCPQKRKPGGFGSWQARQDNNSDMPHDPQKRCAPAFSAPQWGQAVMSTFPSLAAVSPPGAVPGQATRSPRSVARRGVQARRLAARSSTESSRVRPAAGTVLTRFRLRRSACSVRRSHGEKKVGCRTHRRKKCAFRSGELRGRRERQIHENDRRRSSERRPTPPTVQRGSGMACSAPA